MGRFAGETDRPGLDWQGPRLTEKAGTSWYGKGWTKVGGGRDIIAMTPWTLLSVPKWNHQGGLSHTHLFPPLQCFPSTSGLGNINNYTEVGQGTLIRCQLHI